MVRKALTRGSLCTIGKNSKDNNKYIVNSKLSKKLLIIQAEREQISEFFHILRWTSYVKYDGHTEYTNNYI